MSDNNDKKTIALYAVILFTSAFIILLLTAYSQTKFSKNSVEYENLLSTEKKEKIGFKTNLNSAIEENKRIVNELDALKKKHEKTLQDNEELKKSLDENKKTAELEVKVNSILMKAQQEYINGNIVECAVLLHKSIDKTKVKGISSEIYESLVEKTYKKASQELYVQGITSYRNKDFSDAALKFTESIGLSAREYYSDDCYYYLAYSQYKKGDIEAAKKAISDLLLLYPDTTYKKDAEALLNLL